MASPSPKDFVYMSIYRGAISRGAAESVARHRAQIGSENFRKNKFTGKAVNYIEQEIKEAVKLSKNYKRK